MEGVEHHFVIRHKTEEDRARLVREVMNLVHEYELKNIYIEEEKDMEHNKILYNSHTLTCISETNCSNIKIEFKKYFR